MTEAQAAQIIALLGAILERLTNIDNNSKSPGM